MIDSKCWYRNMLHKLELYSPPGFDFMTGSGVYLGAFIALLMHAFMFFRRFQEAYEFLFRHEDGIKVLLSNVLMPTFKSLSISYSYIFFITSWGFYLIRLRYRYFNVETKSGYVMLRLPRRLEYHKRCWAVPVAWIILNYLFFFLIKGLCFIYYRNLVPLSAWPPGQSMNLWSVIL